MNPRLSAIFLKSHPDYGMLNDFRNVASVVWLNLSRRCCEGVLWM